jgi:hypothetical protein
LILSLIPSFLAKIEAHQLRSQAKSMIDFQTGGRIDATVNIGSAGGAGVSTDWAKSIMRVLSSRSFSRSQGFTSTLPASRHERELGF